MQVGSLPIWLFVVKIVVNKLVEVLVVVGFVVAVTVAVSDAIVVDNGTFDVGIELGIVTVVKRGVEAAVVKTIVVNVD
jgi:hypothetical protein